MTFGQQWTEYMTTEVLCGRAGAETFLLSSDVTAALTLQENALLMGCVKGKHCSDLQDTISDDANLCCALYIYSANF